MESGQSIPKRQPRYYGELTQDQNHLIEIQVDNVDNSRVIKASQNEDAIVRDTPPSQDVHEHNHDNHQIW